MDRGTAAGRVSAGVVLVAGEALFDLWFDAAGEVRARPGGGPFNTARTIARLEQPVAYLGRLSTDGFGTRLRSMLANDGVRLQAVTATDDPTTLALAEIDATGSARYSFYVQGTSAPGLTPEVALAAAPREVTILHVGTLGLLFEPIADAMEALVESADAALVVVDPNCRPQAIVDPARYRARLRRVLTRSDVVKVSEEDLAWLDPDRPAEAAARTLLELGPSTVLLTQGAGGVVVLNSEGRLHVGAPTVDVVDTIGAGDAFSGGFLAWWHGRGLDRLALTDESQLRQAAAFAALVAARTCERPGASPPRLRELEPA